MSDISPITGYRELNAEEVAAVNGLKAREQELLKVIKGLQSGGSSADPRWVALGKTHLEQGFMALVRSITRPGD